MEQEIDRLKSMTFALSNDWINKDKENIKPKLHKLGSTDYLTMAILIMTHHLKWNESRFSISEIMEWYGIKRDSALNKIKLLDKMRDKKYLKYSMPVKDIICCYDMSDLFYPQTNFTLLSMYEVQTILDNNKLDKDKDRQVNNTNLLAVYFIIKSYINKDSLIAYPSEDRIVSVIGYISKTSVVRCIPKLMEMKLIYYINRGYDKKLKRNLGNVYTLYDENAISRLETYIRNISFIND